MKKIISSLLVLMASMATSFAADPEDDAKLVQRFIQAMSEETDNALSELYASLTPAEQENVQREFMQSQGVDQVLEYTRKLAKDGDLEAKSSLAAALLQGGRRTPAEIKEGIQALKEAADGGHIVARGRYGFFCLDGRHGLRKDSREAIRYLTEPAQENIEQSRDAFIIALLGDATIDVTKIASQLSWIDGMLQQNHKEALFWKGRALLNGQNGLDIDLKEGVELLERAANAGEKYSPEILGHAYLSKMPRTMENKEKGFRWLKHGAYAGNERCMYGLGYSYFYVEGNFEEGLKWVFKAKEKNEPQAMAMAEKIEEIFQRIAEGNLSAEERRLILRARISERRNARTGSGVTAAHSAERRQMTREEMVNLVKSRQEDRKRAAEEQRLAAEKRLQEQQRRYANLATKRRRLLEESTQPATVLDQERQPSTKQEAHANAVARIKAEAEKAKSHAARSKGKERVDQMQEDGDADLERGQIAPLKLFLPKRAHAIFEKLWVAKTNNDTGDLSNYTDDRVLMTRQEVELLIEALGGAYSSARGRGSHELAVLDSLDSVYLNGEEMTLSGEYQVNPDAQARGAVTLPRNDGNKLKPYNIAQLRALLHKLGYTPQTVRPMEDQLELELAGAQVITGASNNVSNSGKSKGKKPKKGKKKKK